MKSKVRGIFHQLDRGCALTGGHPKIVEGMMNNRSAGLG